jgi:hypothetical protein
MIALIHYEKHDTSGHPLASLYVKAPLFWTHLGTTLLTIYPWINTKKNLIETEVLSDHAIRIHFYSCKNTIIGGGSVRISRGFLTEYHSFAVIPANQTQRADGKTFSVIVSNAGDWTKNLICNPPRELYLRQLPVLGAVSVARIFSPVVIVATGSGIGPCLGMFLQYPQHAFKVVWVARDPFARYGNKIVEAVKATDPDAIIHDTGKDGRTNDQHIVSLARKRYFQTNAEAVVVISNKAVIDTLVLELSKTNIPCYGPIFDS